MRSRVVALVCTFALWNAPHAAGAASRSPAASVAPAPCASPVPPGSPFLAAFAYDIESPSILRFIAALAGVAPRAQQPLFDAGIAALSTPSEQTAIADIAAMCPGDEAAYGSIRAENIVANTWSADVVGDDTRLDRFSTSASAAIGALTLGDRLSAADRATALAPFSSVYDPAKGEPPLQPLAPASCAGDTNARILVASQPVYPPLAGMTGTTGTITIKVSLSDRGFVRAANVIKRTLPDQPGADQIVISAVYSAVASTYVPATEKCIPVASSAIYTAEYSR